MRIIRIQVDGYRAVELQPRDVLKSMRLGEDFHQNRIAEDIEARDWIMVAGHLREVLDVHELNDGEEVEAVE